jgi:hypothetical protein
MSTKQTKKKFALIGTEIATAYLTAKNSIYITLVAFGALLSPFANLLYYGSTAKGILGFTYMSSFLFAIGYPLMAFFFGILLKISAYHIENDMRKIFELLSRAVIVTACFYIYWALVPMTDLPEWQYYSTGIVMALIAGYVSVKAHKFFMKTEEILKGIIRKLFHFIVVDTKNNHPELNVLNYDVELDEVFAWTANEAKHI